MAVNTTNATVNCGLHAVGAYIHAAFVMTKSAITQWIGIWHAPWLIDFVYLGLVVLVMLVVLDPFITIDSDP